jgi:hypothetical protein
VSACIADKPAGVSRGPPYIAGVSALAIAVVCAAGALIVRRIVSVRVPENHAVQMERHRYAPIRIRDAVEGPIEITGRVRAVAEPMAAPLSGRPCAYYQVVISGPGMWGAAFRGPRAACELEIDDGTGRALVHVPPPGDLSEQEVLCALPGTHTEKTGLTGDPPALERLLADPAYPRIDGGLPLFAAEAIVAEGDTLTVAGYAVREAPGSPLLLVTPARQYPVLLIKS